MKHEDDGLQDDDSLDGSPSAGPADRPNAKQRARAQREISRLLDHLAPERSVRVAKGLPADIQLHRTPKLCILQGAARAVSVSWHPPSGYDDTLGEVQLIEWDGVVHIPGSARRSDAGAVIVRQSSLHPVEMGDDLWGWRPSDGGAAIDTAHLAAYCQRLLERTDGEPVSLAQKIV